ncbi:MAG: helix-turn-helix domain-containing protein [Treponema sp.]|jgi:AraC family transcriptional regulator of adaptative response / DNA-3-methyladenine glycosylase II|nr:helix-turn-helix domain-containing protein [Treponema sp.]
MENTKVLYEAFTAKDPRFDGRFFVGVSSTGVYCRPVCRAKQAKIENCTFYPTAAEAEQAGYRPCLLCRPECAPGASITDAASNLVYRATRMLEKNCGSGQSLEKIAERLGYTGRHLRRVFTAEYHVPPVQYLQTCRLLLAKNLLSDTDLPVLDIAMTAGFGSLRRFNALFKTRYHLSPTALRRQTLEKKHMNVTLALGYRPPYPWEKILEFLAGRALNGVEVVKDNEYLRTAYFVTTEGKRIYGWVRVGHQQKANALTVTASETLLPVLPRVLARIRHLFDLYCDPDAVYKTLRTMNSIRSGLCVPGTRVPGCFDVFEMAVRAVLGQQITVKAARTIAARIVDVYGAPVQTGIEGLTRIFPLTKDIAAMGNIANNLGPLGVSSARSCTIYELARALAQGKIDFDLCARPEEEIKKLMNIRGIGSWTAQYIAMRAMEWPDAFLETDAGVKKALQPYTSKELLKMAEAWRPWRSYATVNLWNSL